MYTTLNNEDFSSHLTQIKQAKEKAKKNARAEKLKEITRKFNESKQ